MRLSPLHRPLGGAQVYPLPEHAGLEDSRPPPDFGSGALPEVLESDDGRAPASSGSRPGELPGEGHLETISGSYVSRLRNKKLECRLSSLQMIGLSRATRECYLTDSPGGAKVCGPSPAGEAHAAYTCERASMACSTQALFTQACPFHSCRSLPRTLDATELDRLAGMRERLKELQEQVDFGA